MVHDLRAEMPNPPTTRPDSALSRRVVLKAGGGVVLTALLPLAACDGGRGAPVAGTSSEAPRFLTDAELASLRALVDRLIPADLDPGAAVAGCELAIDRLLAAFQTDPPLIFAGGPFSDRAGAPKNDFLEFVPLDEYEETAWRLAIEGSQGRPELEFNGPVKGMQAIYREGLAQLDARAQQAGFADFAAAPAPLQELIILDSSDATVQSLVDIAYLDTLDGMYGAPEYGGNQGLVGWGFTAFDGDVQPRGYSDDQVVNPDNPGLLDFLLPPSYGRSAPAGPSGKAATGLPLAPLPSLVLSSEALSGAIQQANGSWRELRRQVQAWLPPEQRRG